MLSFIFTLGDAIFHSPSHSTLHKISHFNTHHNHSHHSTVHSYFTITLPHLHQPLPILSTLSCFSFLNHTLWYTHHSQTFNPPHTPFSSLYLNLHLHHFHFLNSSSSITPHLTSSDTTTWEQLTVTQQTRTHEFISKKNVQEKHANRRVEEVKKLEGKKIHGYDFTRSLSFPS